MSFREFLKRIADKWFCLHDWEHRGTVNGHRNGDDMPHSIKYLFICKKCGKSKWEKA